MATRVRSLITLMLTLGIAFVEVRVGAQTVTAVTSVSVPPTMGDFDTAVSSYYKVSARDIAVVRQRRVSDEELPVVMFVAQEASVTPVTVMDLRARGYSWWDISVRYRISAEAYYVPVAGNPGPPYDRVFGYYRNKPRSQWNTIVLADADILNLVHLRFLSEFYRVTPQRVMELRSRSGDIIAVQRAVAGHGGL